MKIKKISFNAKGSFKEGSYRIPFIWVKSYLNKLYKCFENEIDSSIDLYFCKAGQGFAKEIRKKMPCSKIILFKPHLEVSTHIDFLRPIKTFKSLLSVFIEFAFRRKHKKYMEDIYSSDVLIADSRKLKLSFEVLTNKRIYYFKLLEKVNNQNIKAKSSLRLKEKVIILYHGGIKHYNESYPELYKLLKFISKTKKVDFICLSNLSDIKKRISIKNVKSFYHEYEFDSLIKFLKIADLGYVPNFLRPRIAFIKKTHDYLNYLLYQSNLYSITEKNSSNAGRAYLFAQFGIPFICHPTREVISDFSDVKNLEFPINSKEALFILNNYLTNDSYYENLSKSLIKKSKDFDLQNETLKLIEFIKTI